MKKQYKVLIIFMYMIAISASIFFVTDRYEANIVKRNAQFSENVKNMNEMLNLNIDTWSEYYKNYLLELTNDEKVVRLFANQEREKLYNLLYNNYFEMLEEEPTFQILHFHNSNSTSFLRMHNKDKFGDNLSKVRPLIENVHTNHKATYSFESGRYGGSLRIVEPVFYKEKYIGALEVGLDPSEIARSLEEINNDVHFQFVLDKNSINKLADKSKVIKVNDNYAVIKLNDFFTSDILIKILHNDEIVLIEKNNKEFYASNVLTINDYKEKTLGYIIGAFDFTLANQEYDISLLLLILEISLAIVLLIGLIFISNSKINLK